MTIIDNLAGVLKVDLSVALIRQILFIFAEIFRGFSGKLPSLFFTDTRHSVLWGIN